MISSIFNVFVYTSNLLFSSLTEPLNASRRYASALVTKSYVVLILFSNTAMILCLLCVIMVNFSVFKSTFMFILTLSYLTKKSNIFYTDHFFLSF
jgi:hypothetical protein